MVRRYRDHHWALKGVVVAGLIISMNAGCGYQFVGESPLLPKDAKTIFVEPFVNRSRDIGIERELASALRSEFYRRGPLTIVDQTELADLIVSGVIRGIERTVAAVNGNDEVLQYSSVLIVDASLRRREPNVVLWRADAIRLNQLYAGSRGAAVTTSSDFRTGTLNENEARQLTDIQLTEADRKNVRIQLMDRFARELYQRVMEMF